jgi:hypothetical protein
MSHVVPMGSGGVIYIRVMTIGSDIEVVFFLFSLFIIYNLQNLQ